MGGRGRGSGFRLNSTGVSATIESSVLGLHEASCLEFMPKWDSEKPLVRGLGD